jgi:hypothetical protein
MTIEHAKQCDRNAKEEPTSDRCEFEYVYGARESGVDEGWGGCVCRLEEHRVRFPEDALGRNPVGKRKAYPYGVKPENGGSSRFDHSVIYILPMGRIDLCRLMRRRCLEHMQFGPEQRARLAIRVK